MTAAQWQRVEDIFDHVVDKSPSHRRDYLDMVCEDDDTIRQEVERLLTAADVLEDEGSVAGTFLKAAAGPPAEIGDYRLGDMLGHGGMGEVYAARHQRHGDVALKLLPVFLVQDASARERFENEARLLGELEHPSLCQLYEYFVTDDYACIAMERVDGSDLSAGLRDGPLSFHEALGVVGTLAGALAVTHAHGVAHRDIKPGNVIVPAAGGVAAKLLDFGVAKFADLRLTATGQAIGSPRYMSPEQWLGSAVDGRTDLWSLGVLWYEMLAGQRPFDGDSPLAIASHVLEGDYAALPAQSRDGVDLGPVAGIIDSLLQKDPVDRVADCDALLAQIEGLAG
jgi:serine/threonine protein kinase